MNNLSKTLLLLAILPFNLMAIIAVPKHAPESTMSEPNNSFIDPKIDYGRFRGRVTDKGDSGQILKVQVENNNTKFLKTGDILYFKVNNHADKYYCKGSVRSIEDFYFSMYVQDFSECWSEGKYFPRGMQLNFRAPKLEQRVFEASKYRELLILRKESFLKQLNEINHFLWTFDQQRLKTAAEYDEQINRLRRQKQLALDNLLNKKKENIMLQTELIKKLDSVDESLDHYKVERQEYLKDRWAMDHDTGLPFKRRPQEMKEE
tara:strand:- start:15 stop:800 length:786 start_codon:yes stop_codon:yes gene_type:complete